jgi:hypothetical protein
MMYITKPVDGTPSMVAVIAAPELGSSSIRHVP